MGRVFFFPSCDSHRIDRDQLIIILFCSRRRDSCEIPLKDLRRDAAEISAWIFKDAFLID